MKYVGLTGWRRNRQYCCDKAAQQYRSLVAGEPPLLAVRPDAEQRGIPLEPDEQCYSAGTLGSTRYYGTNLEYHHPGLSVVGSPTAVAGAIVGHEIAGLLRDHQARHAAAPQFRSGAAACRPDRPACLCLVHGQWLTFASRSVAGTRLYLRQRGKHTNTRHDAEERRVTELYTATASQLGSNTIPHT